MADKNEAISQAVSLPFLIHRCSLTHHRCRRLALIGLFSIGFLLVAVAVARLPIYGNGTSQVNRNTWGSVEEFAAAFVANVPTLFALRRREDVTGSISLHSRRQSEIVRVRQVRGEKIAVTRSIELRHEIIGDVKNSDEFQVVCVERSSNENLV
jgi:hypothetical protein